MVRIQHLVPVSEWGYPHQRPLLISGPCGVESEAQIHAVASALAKLGVHVLRGGIWKPRTRPDSFQGIGSTGLHWLKEAARQNGLPATVEVATPRHVEEALRAGIDLLWIGARTTVNPFLVQEIADALRGTDVPVLVKNPINPDLELWIGAIERVHHAGIRRIAAVHRGFSGFEKSPYRNAPAWNIPIELKRRIPELPMICDPSHICGNRSLLAQVAQTALDLNYDGLMIESHPDPEQALSDREQQLTPAALGLLLDNLVIRQPNVDDVLFNNLLEELRYKIDGMDAELLDKIAARMSVAREIGRYKKENNMTILQVERWDEILRTRLQYGSDKELTAEFVTALYQLIHQESIFQQTRVMNTPVSAVLENGNTSEEFNV
jgi:chorismate mutase